jgi:hypothetical protein
VDRATTNGGFPLPVESEPTRLVRVRHGECGRETRVRLPRTVPARAVRRVVCERCELPFEADPPAEAPARRRPSRDVAWRFASVPVAAVLVIGAFLGLNALQGGGDAEVRPAAPAEASNAAGGSPRVVDATGRGAAAAKAPGNAELVSEAAYTLALPAGWDRVSAQGGATFAAVAPGGEADATLWIEQDPKLDFGTFEARSLDQLEQLAGSAKVIERTTGPSPESTVIRIAADAPQGAPRYEAVLRAGPGPDPYWYYLATTVQPDASAEAIEGVEVLQGSLVPEGAR